MQTFENLRKIPSSIESEKAVLGGLFIKPDSFSEVAEIIKPEDFYRSSYKLIFEAMRDLQNSDQSIDVLLVMERLKKMAKFEEVGGEKIILEIIEDTPTAANILSYATIIREKSTLRRLGDIGTSIVEMAYEGYEEVNTILDKAESLIFKISENKQSKDIIALKDIIGDEFLRLQEVYDNKGSLTGISSGFKNYDHHTGGFNPSDLIILAARPA
ncbi:MAG: replicative DNA helicase, partial [Fusobacteriaceae bacterium]